MAILVSGMICFVNSVNERDFHLLIIACGPTSGPASFLEGLLPKKVKEVGSNNRSVMPLDVLGRTRATLDVSTSFAS